MRPCSLKLTAFGPFGDTQVVDFDALADQGLFVIAGPNGAGKTSIFDGVYFALFGDLPGSRHGYKQVRSDHAPPDRLCTVEFEFVTGDGRRWFIDRSPSQSRPKRRGQGMTEHKPDATLYQVTSAGREPQVRGATQVKAACETLLGLTGAQFERVALLPQGEFSRFLKEGTSKRGPLLRTLFGTEIFDRATAALQDQAKAAVDAQALRRADHQSRFECLWHQVHALHVSDSGESVVGESGVDGPLGVGPRAMAWLGERLTEFEQAVVEPLSAAHSQAEERQISVVEAHHKATQAAERFERRQSLLAESSRLDAGLASYEHDRLALDRARAAESMAETLIELDHQRGVLDGQQARIRAIRDQISGHARICGLPPEIVAEPVDPAGLRCRFESVASALNARQDHDEELARIDADLDRAKSAHGAATDRHAALTIQRANRHERGETIARRLAELDDLGDPDQARADRDRLVDLLDRRSRLGALAHEIADTERGLANAQAQAVQVDEELKATHQADARQPVLEARASAAADELAETERRRADLAEFTGRRERLDRLRGSLRKAQQRADSVLDAFLTGASVRLAAELIDGEPCGVCGSVDHPAPARGTDQPPSEADLHRAQEERDEMARQVAGVEGELERLRGLHPDIATWTVDQLEQHRVHALSAATSSQAAAESNRAKAMTLDHVTRASARIADRVDRLRAELADRRAEQNHLGASLGDHAAEPTQVLADRVEAAAQLVHRTESAIPETGELRAEADQLIEMTATDDAQLAELGLVRAGAEGQIQELETRRAQVVDDFAVNHPDPSDRSGPVPGSTRGRDLAAQVQAAHAAIDAIGELAISTAGQEAAATSVRRLTASLLERIAGSPFDSPEAARVALRSRAEIIELDGKVRSFANRRADVAAKLDELVDTPTDPPDPHATDLARAQAARDLNRVTNELLRARLDLDRHRDELTRLGESLAQAEAAEADARRLERVAGLVNGTNDQRMSLENWVLAAHLRDVVDHANVRLADFTQDRFELCVVAEGNNRLSKWGLDLEIEDRVTGTRRPTEGLSGGELFCTSLALALGLADVLMAQSGGVRLDAIFIDEGFGALDESSIDAAIDLLDGLRDQGAMVGVITHVPALLSALPAGIAVDKAGPFGSRIVPAGGSRAA